MNQMVGYKYIYWCDDDDENAVKYIHKAESGMPIHYLELKDNRGMLDTKEMPGIYFCKSLDDLYIWIKELFECVNPYAIELLEIRPIGEVKERQYEDGRIAYVTPMCYCRILKDNEIPSNIKDLIREFFEI